MGSFVSPTSFWKPDYIGESAWLEHAPFAFWLVDSLRPSTFVELGTHRGFSYLSICQAVARLGIPTRAFAIDTWEGDEQTGFYGEEVLTELAAYHDPRFSSFSRLVRSTFDEAVSHFEDSSIDLLHVDGLHTYEAVHHDYETWQAKLSSRCVVLFHDTNVRERDFGVHRLFAELRADHPGFEFVHGHGLGLLAPGTDLPSRVKQLLEAETSATLTADIRQVYARLGAAVRLEFELGEVQRLVEQERTSLGGALEARGAEIGRLEEELAARTADVAGVEEELAALDEKLRTQRAELAMREEESAAQANSLTVQQAHASELEQLLSVVMSSESWRITAPLRHIGTGARSLVAGKGVAAHGLLLRRLRTLVPIGAQRYLRRRFPAMVETMIDPAVLRPQDVPPTSPPGRRFEVQGAYSDAIQARYERWRTRTEPDAIELEAQRRSWDTLAAQPLVSIVVPVFDPPVDVLRDTIASALAQTYPKLELCLANAGGDPACASLVAEFVERDTRIRQVSLDQNGGISANTNAALHLATGEFVAMLDHDDILSPDALYRVVELIGEEPDVDVLYSDEDRLTADGRRILPFLKPDWSPEFLHSYMWVGHLSVYRRSLLERLGGLRSEFDGSQDYDLMLRAADATDRFAHVPRVLYHWRMVPGSAAAGGKSDARRSNLAALQDAIDRSGRSARVAEYPWANRVVFDLEDRPLVSIIVPTDDVQNARACVDGIFENTSYDRLEIVVVANSNVISALEEQHRSGPANVRFVRYDGVFNFSLKCNAGARESTGEYLLFMNDDVAPIASDWLEAMLQYAQLPEIGGVSPKLLYADDSIQYAGLVSGVPGIVGTAFHPWPRDDGSYHSMALSVRNVSCLTGACMLLRARDFWSIGGWDEVNTPISHSDFDLSYRLAETGLRLVYQPFAELRHLGHQSRRTAEPDPASVVTRADEGADIYLLHRWGDRVGDDPFYPPGMRTLLYENPVDFKIVAPPTYGARD